MSKLNQPSAKMKYILKHKSGNNYQLNISIPLEEFKKSQQSFTLFTVTGNYVGVAPIAFLDECRILGDDIMIPIEEVTEDDDPQGFLIIEYPFDKQKVLEVLAEMHIPYDNESKEALEYFVTDEPEEFLTLYRNTTYHKGTFKRCKISESENKIQFFTQWGFLIKMQKLMFSIDANLYEFKYSDRYKIYYMPADTSSENYKKYK
jgi:hypothetical protein